MRTSFRSGLNSEIVELDNGLLARSLTPYARLNVEYVRSCAANVKISTKMLRLLESEREKSYNWGEEDEDDNPEHQLDQIFGNHLREGGSKGGTIGCVQ